MSDTTQTTPETSRISDDEAHRIVNAMLDLEQTPGGIMIMDRLKAMRDERRNFLTESDEKTSHEQRERARHQYHALRDFLAALEKEQREAMTHLAHRQKLPGELVRRLPPPPAPPAPEEPNLESVNPFTGRAVGIKPPTDQPPSS